MNIRRTVLATIVAGVMMAAVPGGASAQNIHWGAGGNWYRADYGQVFAGAAIVSASPGYYYVQSGGISGKVLNPCGSYQYIDLEAQGEVHSLSAQSVSWTIATVANSGCRTGTAVPYPITISGTHRAEYQSGNCWVSYSGGVSDMTVNWGGVTTSFFPSNNQFSNVCRYGI